LNWGITIAYSPQGFIEKMSFFKIWSAFEVQIAMLGKATMKIT
jgi:hypothetical protein